MVDTVDFELFRRCVSCGTFTPRGRARCDGCGLLFLHDVMFKAAVDGREGR